MVISIIRQIYSDMKQFILLIIAGVFGDSHSRAKEKNVVVGIVFRFSMIGERLTMTTISTPMPSPISKMRARAVGR